MPLPADQTPWPPRKWRDVYQLYREHAAWYSGDPNRIAKVFSDKAFTPTKKGQFWAREVSEERRTMLHVPLPGDIAATSANMLFGEPPKVRIPEAVAEQDDEGNVKDPDPQAVKAQERLNQIILKGDVISRLLEGGETCSALGGVLLKVDWDIEVAKYPILSINQVDNAVMEYRSGFLVAVTFWKELDDPAGRDDAKVWRFMERHEIAPDGKAIRYYGLYQGTSVHLGKRFPLDRHPETEGLPDEEKTPIEGIDVRYIPNMRPHRRFRGWPIGKSDFDGVEGLFDALDEVYSSWMRDIKLAKGRVIVPEEWLKKDPRTGELLFDMEEEVFTMLDMGPNTLADGKNPMTIAQFAIRAEEHKQTALEILERIIVAAGYSPQDFGFQIEGRAEAGTALNIRRQKSLNTQAKKAGYWKSALEDIFHMMLVVDRELLGNTDTPTDFRPVVEMQDGVQQDINQIADALSKLETAGALSTEVKVRWVHSDWDDKQVLAEVERIHTEKGVGMPNPELTGEA